VLLHFASQEKYERSLLKVPGPQRPEHEFNAAGSSTWPKPSAIVAQAWDSNANQAEGIDFSAVRCCRRCEMVDSVPDQESPASGASVEGPLPTGSALALVSFSVR